MLLSRSTTFNFNLFSIYKHQLKVSPLFIPPTVPWQLITISKPAQNPPKSKTDLPNHLRSRHPPLIPWKERTSPRRRAARPPRQFAKLHRRPRHHARAARGDPSRSGGAICDGCNFRNGETAPLARPFSQASSGQHRSATRLLPPRPPGGIMLYMFMA